MIHSLLLALSWGQGEVGKPTTQPRRGAIRFQMVRAIHAVAHMGYGRFAKWHRFKVFFRSYNGTERTCVYLDAFSRCALSEGFDWLDRAYSFLSALHLLAVALSFDCVACPFTYGAQLIQALLRRCF